MADLVEGVYGRSGAGKTTWGLKLARWFWETRGLRTRWALGDGGGATLQGTEEFIEIFPYTLREHPFETTVQLCEGWWPRDPADPKSPMIPPTKELRSSVGLAVIEGLSVMSDYIMGTREGGLAARSAKGEVLNNDASFKVVDGSVKLGGNSRTHYGFGQRVMWENVGRSGGIPVEMVLWTGHERQTDGDAEAGTKEPIIGPDVCGRALTTKIGAAFGNLIHLHPVHVKRKAKDPLTGKEVEIFELEYRAYTRDHYDPNLAHYVRYLANCRFPAEARGKDPSLMPEWLPPDPLEFYRRLSEGRKLAAELAAQKNAAYKSLSLV